MTRLTCRRPKVVGAETNQAARRRRDFGLGRTIRLVEIGQDPPRPFQIARTRIGQRHRRVVRCSRRMPSLASSAATSRVTAGIKPKAPGGRGKKPLASATETKADNVSKRSISIVRISQLSDA